MRLFARTHAHTPRTGNIFAGRADKGVIPSVGLEFSIIKYKGWKIKLTGLGGSKSFRGQWKNFYDGAHGVVFVVDSADADRMDEVKEVFDDLKAHDKVVRKPILVFANKQVNAISYCDSFPYDRHLLLLIGSVQCVDGTGSIDTSLAAWAPGKNNRTPGVAPG